MPVQTAFPRPNTAEELLDHLNRHATIDAFLDQTFHVYEHGGRLTELGRLVLEERLKKEPSHA